MRHKNGAVKTLPRVGPPAPVPGEVPDAAKADYEALARAQREERADMCTQAVYAAIAPILERYQCRLGVRQAWLDGKPGPVEILCVTVD